MNDIARTIESARQDLSYAVRIMTQNPLFTFIAIFTLAIGIGVNTAIFSVIDAVLLRPLPYPQAKQLTVVWSAFGQEGRAPGSGPELVSLRERSRIFDQFAGIWVQREALTGNGEPEAVTLGWVSSNFLSLLSAHPEAGRYFLPAEEGSGSGPVVVLSNKLWQRRFGGDPKIVGRSILVSGHLCAVVGVLPANFKLVFPEGASVPPDIDIFVPFKWELATQPRDRAYIRIIGRLRDGQTVQRGQEELDNIASQLRAEFGEYASENLHLRALSLQEDSFRNARPALLALFAGTGFVLLIACANVAMLLLSRTNERTHEITLRAALGAQPRRVIRQLLTESLLLSTMGGIAGLFVSWAILKSLWALQPAELTRTGPAGLNLAVLGFNLLASTLCGLLFGLAPALMVRTFNLGSVLREVAQTVTERRFSRQLLIGCEVALTFVLLTSSVLLLRTFISILRVDPGFNAQNVITFQISLPGSRYPKPELAINFIRELQRKLASLPDVQSAGVVSHLPFDDNLPNWYAYFWRDGAPKEEQNTVMADHRSVLPGFFDSIGARFVAGRNFDTSDEVANRKVVIVDDSLARQLWPKGNELGQKLVVENGNFVQDVAEVVGVVKHVQYHSLTNQVRPQLYLPYAMAVRANMSFTVRTKSSSSRELIPMIRSEIASLDKDLPVANIRLLEDYVSDARLRTRFVTTLCGVLAAIALLLCCVGIFGMTANAVTKRTREFGIRMALGAQRQDIAVMVLRKSMAPVVSGGVIGLLSSLGLMPLLSSLLYGVKPLDPAVLIPVLLVLFVIALFAAFLPTQRVIRSNPISALRHE